MVKKEEWIVEEFDEMFGDGIISFEIEKYEDDEEEGEDVQSTYENHSNHHNSNYYRGKEPEEEESPISSSPNNIMNRYYHIFPNARPINTPHDADDQ